MNFLVSILLLAFLHPSQSAPPDIYSFKVPALDGSSIDFSQFKGKKILIVNDRNELACVSKYGNNRSRGHMGAAESAGQMYRRVGCW